MGRDGPRYILCQRRQSVRIKGRCYRISDELEVRMREIRNRVRVSDVSIPFQQTVDHCFPYLQAERVRNRFQQNLENEFIESQVGFAGD